MSTFSTFFGTVVSLGSAAGIGRFGGGRGRGRAKGRGRGKEGRKAVRYHFARAGRHPFLTAVPLGAAGG